MDGFAVLGGRIKRFREQRGWSLTGLAERCGIAKSTLSKLESGEGNPTVETLWAIADALDIPFGALAEEKVITAPGIQGMDGEGAVVRLIEQPKGPPKIEVYAVEYAHGYRRESSGHRDGVREQVTVISGAMLVGDPSRPKLLYAGESHAFAADKPHLYAAFDGAAKALVVLEYPRRAALHGPLVLRLDWPEDAEGWQGLRLALDRLRIEVANGGGARLVRFGACREISPQALQGLRGRIADEESLFSWPLHHVTGHDAEGPYCAILPLRFTSAFRQSAPQRIPARHVVLSEALGLSCLIEEGSRALDGGGKRGIADAAAGDSWVLGALGAEALTQRGELTMPGRLGGLGQERLEHQIRDDAPTFSSRINVNHYDAYELLHPAYARQVVAMAEDVVELLDPSNGGGNVEGVDVGTGPGTTLLMLKELLPRYRFLAIEPDATAFACLRRNIAGQAGLRARQVDFLQVDLPSDSRELITSVGASHHFNTAFMLQQAYRLLRPSGVLVVADEFLPPFLTAIERDGALVRHHAAYILSAMAWIGEFPLESMESMERILFRRFQDALCLAVMEAEAGLVSQAVERCRELYLEAMRPGLDSTPTHPVGAYLRFFRLELQAMCAGFDYEVERKTHPRRFHELANLAGLELVRHRRVFATAGDDDWGGGTHVFAFRKPPEDTLAAMHGAEVTR